MVFRRQLAPLAALLALGGAIRSSAGDAVPLDASQVKRSWHARLDSRHFSAEIALEMHLGGLEETRELRVWRDDVGTESERIMVRFESPPDLRNVALLYMEHADLPNDYFLYQPSIRRIRRLPETIANDDVYGIDLEFLGFGVAQSEPTEIDSMSRVILNGVSTYKLVERATRSNPRFDRRSTWLDRDTFVALRTEHERAGRLVMIAQVRDVQWIQGVPTPMLVDFERLDTKRRVQLRVHRVDYERAIPESYFTAMALLRSSIKSESR